MLGGYLGQYIVLSESKNFFTITMIAPIVNTIPIVLKSDQRTKYYIIHHAIIADITYILASTEQ